MINKCSFFNEHFFFVAEEGVEPTTYGLWVHHSNHWTIPPIITYNKLNVLQPWSIPRLPHKVVHMVINDFINRVQKGLGCFTLNLKDQGIFYSYIKAIYLFYNENNRIYL